MVLFRNRPFSVFFYGLILDRIGENIFFASRRRENHKKMGEK